MTCCNYHIEARGLHSYARYFVFNPIRSDDYGDLHVRKVYEWKYISDIRKSCLDTRVILYHRYENDDILDEIFTDIAPLEAVADLAAWVAMVDEDTGDVITRAYKEQYILETTQKE